MKFKKDLKKFKHKTVIIKELNEIIKLLVDQKPLLKKHVDHPLSGNWNPSRECHINPDVLLIYRIDAKIGHLYLERLGSHSELF